MLHLADITANLDAYIAGLQKRNLPNAKEILAEVIKLDEDRKATQHQLDNNLAEANQIAKQIGGFMKEGKKDEAEKAKATTGELKQESKLLGEKLVTIQNQLKDTLYQLPNIPHPTVPSGASEDDNEEIKRVGDLPVLYEKAVPHWDLIKQYDIIDFDLGVKITGAGFPVYKGKGARLQRALINFFLDRAEQTGYNEIQPPILVNEASGYGTGQLPDKEGQMYHINEEDFYLIPTAEVPLTNIYRDVILNEEELPVKNVGYTPCFRREAGSWGAHVRGLNRLHQFDKVEIIQIVKPEDSYDTLQLMCNHVEQLLQDLNLPYRILKLCAGDLGFTSALTFDFEVFSAAQNKWLEVSSVSNFENFQANRLKLRYKNKDGKKQLLHTLNGSALALPRILAAILENNQSEIGIQIPDVLQPYTNFSRIEL